MSEVKEKIAELFLKGCDLNRGLQEHIRFDRLLDKAESKLDTLRLENSSAKDISIASSELRTIEDEIEKKVVFESGSVLTKEEYTEELVKLSEEYFDLISNNANDIKDVVFQIKSFDALTSAKLDKIVEDLETENPNIKRVYQGFVEGVSSFDSTSVFLMPLSEFENFSSMIKSEENGLKCVENPYFFVNHLNQDISLDKISASIEKTSYSTNIERNFSGELGLYVCPLNTRKVKDQKHPDIVNAFKEILEQQELGLEYDNPAIRPSIKAINTRLRYQDSKEMVTVISESDKLVKAVNIRKEELISSVENKIDGYSASSKRPSINQR